MFDFLLVWLKFHFSLFWIKRNSGCSVQSSILGFPSACRDFYLLYCPVNFTDPLKVGIVNKTVCKKFSEIKLKKKSLIISTSGPCDSHFCWLSYLLRMDLVIFSRFGYIPPKSVDGFAFGFAKN